MARIRTIKPEFPQSESMGRVSREARLTFVLLWTIADDSGRLRGNSRMLASLLFPYDDDAPSLIDGWLVELEREGCITRYRVGDASYLQIANWLEHQKIDKPSKSKIPQFGEGSEILAKPRERSSEDQGPKDQGSEDQEGKGVEAGASAPPAADPIPAVEPADETPLAAQVEDPLEVPALLDRSKRRGSRLPDNWEPSASLLAWAMAERSDLDLRRTAASFRDYWQAQAGQRGVKVDWDATFRNWVRNERPGLRPNGQSRTTAALDGLMRQVAR